MASMGNWPAPRTGSAIGAAYSQLRNALLKFVSISVIVGLPLVIFGAIASGVNTLGQSNRDLSLVLNALLCCVSTVVLALSVAVPWMDGAHTFAAIERLFGRTPGARESYSAVRGRFASLWVVDFIRNAVALLLWLPVGLGILGGVMAITMRAGASVAPISGFSLAETQNFFAVTAACCLPLGLVTGLLGSWLTTRWSVATPVVVAEGAGALDALKRSTELVKGHFWSVVGRTLGMFISQLMVIGLPVLVLSSCGFLGAINPDWQNTAALTAIVGTLISLFGNLGTLITRPLWNILGVENYMEFRGVPAAIPAATISPAQPTLMQPPSYGGNVGSVVQMMPASGMPMPSSATPIQVNAGMTPAQRIGVYFSRLRTEGPSGPLLRDLGASYADVGDLGAALDAYARAREYMPQDAELSFNLFRLHVQRKDVGSARVAMADYLAVERNQQNVERVTSNPSFREYLP